MRSRELSAPRTHGELRSWPALTSAGSTISQNRSEFAAAADVNCGRCRLGEWRSAARRAAAACARDYTRRLTADADDLAGGDVPWIVTGHQPALFHPGVWAKNLACRGLADRYAGVAINLIVDNDLIATTALAVPRGPRSAPRLELVPFLPPQSPQPWEEVFVTDPARFAAAGSHAAETLSAEWGYQPVITDVWRDAVASDGRMRLADRFARMRALQERRWGLGTWELPLSRLQETDAFRWFVAILLAEAGRFRAIHNQVLDDYRLRNRVRSRSHPVPELRQRDDWIEAPFWAWRVDDATRRPLFVRTQGRRLELAADREPFGALRVADDGDQQSAVSELTELASKGWRIRSRALTTTLFTRLGLADLFIHGIGGAKYDELTDGIIEQFFGLTPPHFLTVTATMQLPLGEHAVSELDALSLRRQLRDLTFNADRLLTSPQATALSAEKHRLLTEITGTRSSRSSRAERRRQAAARRALHQPLQTVQTHLRGLAEETREITRTQLETLESQLAANRVLQSREYAWCLFPEAELQALTERILAAI